MQRAFSIISEHAWNGEVNAALCSVIAGTVQSVSNAAICNGSLLFCCAGYRGTNVHISFLCSVGIKPPGIEVRFKDIFIETSVYTNVSRNLPSVFNAYRGAVEVSCSVIPTPSQADKSSDVTWCLRLA